MNENKLVTQDSKITFIDFLKGEGLPTVGIIASEDERRRILVLIPDIIAPISFEKRSNSNYLSKFIAASSAGLFDAALNYVWNEVVRLLREKVILYGIDLFFDEAVGPSIRINYNNEEDLKKIKDQTLLNTLLKMELIDSILYKKLSHILDMRNEIGASHYNTDFISPIELGGWLEICVNDVISQEPSVESTSIKRIVDEIKRETLLVGEDTNTRLSNLMNSMSLSMKDNFLNILFGIYISDKSNGNQRNIILSLIQNVWSSSSDQKKYDLGNKVAIYGQSFQKEKEELGEEFLKQCNGLSFLPETEREVKLAILTNNLNTVHYEWDNFYKEAPIVREIILYLDNGIPKKVFDNLIHTILECRIGNGVSYCKGVSPSGKSYYDIILSNLDNQEIFETLKFVYEDIFKIGSNSNKIFNIVEIVKLFSEKTLNPKNREIIDFLLEDESKILSKFTSNKYKEFIK